MSFCHLHLHSEYSLLDGACRIEDIAKAAYDNHMSSVAITDHGVMYGVVDFWLACKKYGIKPIIGCEVYVAPGSLLDRKDQRRYHLILLAKNETGYKNLIYMVSKSFTDGFYVKPRIDMDLLEEHHEGLICMSACLAGYISQMVASGNYEEAENHAVRMDRLFGRGNYYLELQNHGISRQQEVNAFIKDIHEKHGIPMVCSNDVHYINKSDADNQAMLMCIQTNSRFSDGRPLGFETDEFYFKSEEQMKELFGEFEDAIENTQRIADMCDYEFDFSHLYLPRFKPDTGEDPVAYLKRLAYEGFKRKIDSNEITYTNVKNEKVYLERIEYELSVIEKMGYSEYFLIVADFINAAKSMKIPTGPGRGSGAGSLVAYLIGITDVDSIKFDLMFERFLNPERVSMPDFDTDFDYERRDEVIEYVSQKYGRDRVSGIITFGTLAAKAVVKDVGRALGMSYSDVDKVSKTIPDGLHVTLSQALEGKLGDMCRESPEVERLISFSMALEGMPRHASAHAAGIVITDKPVYDYVPMTTGNGMVLTQFPMETVAKLGLLKFDFLGLRYLTIIDDTEKQIRRFEPDFDIKRISFDDEETYKFLSSMQTDGVFQLESAGMKKLLAQMKPACLEDIISAISLYRPGPMESIPMFLENRLHPEKIVYKHEILKDILEVTSGCIIYQEQVMQICRAVAGFTFGRADVIRRAMSKKKAAEMEKERHAFIYGDKDENGNVLCVGAIANGVSEQTATEIFDEMSSFASYAFNKSHATAYAFLSYRTAYLKRHYPCEYLASLLTSVMGNLNKTAVYLEEARRNNISVAGPDINEGYEKYSVVLKDGVKSIRFGLLGIKNVGLPFLQAIVKEREENGKFKSFTDFISRMIDKDINKRQVEYLIKSGACDSLGQYRSQLLCDYEEIIDKYSRRAKNAEDGQVDFFSMTEMTDYSDEEHVYPDLPDINLKEKLLLEKEATGMFFSGHPIDSYSQHSKVLKTVQISDINNSFSEEETHMFEDGQQVAIAGIISNRVDKKTRNGDPMAFVTIEDRYSEIELVVFPKVLEKCRQLLLVDNPIAVMGKISLSDDNIPKILVEKAIQLLQNSKDYVEDNSEQVQTKVVEAKEPEQVNAEAEKLYLKLAVSDNQLMDRLSTILGFFPGRTLVTIYIEDSKRIIKMQGGVNINPTLIELLKRILGRDSVIIK